jgi:uncharacterized lipoprotein YmbA
MMRALILTLALALTGCGGGSEPDTFNPQPSTGALPAQQVQR